MLRITKMEENAKRARIKVEGRLVSTWVNLVELEYQRARNGSRQIVLDLTHVTFVDDAGLRMLRMLAQDHLVVLNTSDFIHHLLCQPGSSS